MLQRSIPAISNNPKNTIMRQSLFRRRRREQWCRDLPDSGFGLALTDQAMNGCVLRSHEAGGKFLCIKSFLPIIFFFCDVTYWFPPFRCDRGPSHPQIVTQKAKTSSPCRVEACVHPQLRSSGALLNSGQNVRLFPSLAVPSLLLRNRGLRQAVTTTSSYCLLYSRDVQSGPRTKNTYPDNTLLPCIARPSTITKTGARCQKIRLTSGS